MPTVRLATADDADATARLLHDFNAEFGDPSPGVEFMTRRVGELIRSGDVTVLLAGEGPDGLAVLRFRPWLWGEGLDCYLEELYVVPERRGQGIGQAIMEAAMDAAREAGAARMDLGTSVDDTAARGLYEKLGFTNLEGPDGPRMLFYERDL